MGLLLWLIVATIGQFRAARAEETVSQPGQAMLRQALAAAVRHESIAASVRHRANMLGYRLFGKGTYLQQGRGLDIQTRLELECHLGQEHYGCVQIADGRFVWTDWQFPDRRSVLKVDLHKVAEAFRDASPMDIRARVPVAGVGGLPMLLRSLHAGFAFEPPRPAAIGALDAWRLIGRARGPSPHDPDTQTAGGELRAENPTVHPHVPQTVQLLLGREDLFPYVVQFRRDRMARPMDRETSDPDCLLLLEMYEVRFGARIDSRQFVYRNDSVRTQDVTEQYLR